MAVIRKHRSGKYQLDYYSGGKRHRPLFQTKAEAEAAKRMVLGVDTGGDSGGDDDLKPMTLKAAINFYYENISKTKTAGKNEKKYFERFFRDCRQERVIMVHDVNQMIVEKIRAKRLTDRYQTPREKAEGLPGRQYKPSAVNREFATIRHFFGKCVDWKAIRKNPFDRLENLPAKKNPRRVWTDEEFHKVVSKLPMWAAKVMWGTYWLGAGATELGRANWGDVDWGRGTVILKRFKGTGDEVRRYQPIPVPMMRALEAEYELAKRDFRGKPTDPIFVNSKRNRVNSHVLAAAVSKVVKELGLPDGTVPYGIRHKFATELLEDGVSDEVARRLMGHQSARTLTDNYAHVRGKALKDAIEIRTKQAERVLQIGERAGKDGE